VLRADLPCSPCYLRQLSRCTHNHDCMKNVAATTVIERAEKIIAALPAARPKPPSPGRS